MKSKAVLFIFGLIGCVTAFAVEPVHTELVSKVDKAFEALLMERHSPLGRLQCWAGRLKRNFPVSDEVLLSVMIATVRQDQTTANLASDLNPAADPYVASRAAGYRMELYPGNPDLEAAILDSIRKADLSKQEDTLWLNKVANLGSEDLVRETRGLITDSRRLEIFDREVGGRAQPRFARNRFPEGIRFQNWVEPPLGPSLYKQ